MVASIMRENAQNVLAPHLVRPSVTAATVRQDARTGRSNGISEVLIQRIKFCESPESQSNDHCSNAAPGRDDWSLQRKSEVLIQRIKFCESRTTRFSRSQAAGLETPR